MKKRVQENGARAGASEAADAPTKKAADPRAVLQPSATVLTHLGSLVVHLDEFLESVERVGTPLITLYPAAAFDLAAINSCLESEEVKDWLDGMKRLALLPVKRSESES
jgi:hypothetical protein